MEDASTIADLDPVYRCPGESHAIDRSVHVARLAAFYPPCVDCLHRHDTAGLTPRQLRQRAEVERRSSRGLQWTAEGLFGTRTHDVTPAAVERFAAALAAAAWQTLARAAQPTVLVGNDGSWTTADFVPAACRSFALAGCRALETGAVTFAALAFAAAHSQATAAMWIGNASGRPHGHGDASLACRRYPVVFPGGARRRAARSTSLDRRAASAAAERWAGWPPTHLTFPR